MHTSPNWTKSCSRSTHCFFNLWDFVKIPITSFSPIPCTRVSLHCFAIGRHRSITGFTCSLLISSDCFFVTSSSLFCSVNILILNILIKKLIIKLILLFVLLSSTSKLNNNVRWYRDFSGFNRWRKTSGVPQLLFQNTLLYWYALRLFWYTDNQSDLELYMTAWTDLVTSRVWAPNQSVHQVS